MVKNKNGDVYTYTEVMDKSINEINIDIKDTEAMSKKLDKLVLKLEATKECRHTYKKLDGLYEAVGGFLPEDKKKLIFDIDDCFTEILIMYEEYFYKNGYKDGQRSKGLFKRLFSDLFHK